MRYSNIRHSSGRVAGQFTLYVGEISRLSGLAEIGGEPLTGERNQEVVWQDDSGMWHRHKITETVQPTIREITGEVPQGEPCLVMVNNRLRMVLWHHHYATDNPEWNRWGLDDWAF
jgi:hypothetical protein